MNFESLIGRINQVQDANEDRNANNANMIYDVDQGRLVAIDFGCILNTATFDYPLSQLTSTDTILWSELFKQIVYGVVREKVDKILIELKDNYPVYLENSRQQVGVILKEMPEQWHVPTVIVKEKLTQLFDADWTAGVWNNFVECVKENM